MRIQTCCAALALALTGGVARGEFARVVSFGDSLSDVGNLYELTNGFLPPSPPYFAGRFSNGPLWVEHFTNAIGLAPQTASLSGGANYAYAGSETGSGGTFGGQLLNAGSQIDQFLASDGPQPGDLVTLWSGGNDLLNGQSNVGVPVSNIAGHVSELAAAGAKSFLVMNLPPLGLTPLNVGTPDEAILNQRSIAFNQQLETALDELGVALDIEIFQFDVFAFYQEVLSNPGAFGFTNTTGTALNEDNGIPVGNPNDYVFWDSFHPTAAAHAYLGQRVAEFIPEPGSLLLLTSGLMMLNRRPKHAGAHQRPIHPQAG